MQKENLKADREKWHSIFRGTVRILTSKKKQWKLEDNGTRFLPWLEKKSLSTYKPIFSKNIILKNYNKIKHFSDK